LELNNFLKKISGKYFKKNKNIENAPWKYRKQKNIKFFFLKIKKNIVGVIVFINFKFSRHLSFFYIIKKFRGKNLGNILFNRYFLNTRKIKTIHVIKSLDKALIFYNRKRFIINKNFNNPAIKKWILRCQKFDKKIFEKRYLLYNVNNEKVLLPK
jgi:predicted acetyltransferase